MKKSKCADKLEILAVISGLTLFSALSFGNMTRWSLWFDESFSVYLQRFSFWDIAKYTASDVHPPLYYWLLKIWCGVFGTSELAIRSLSWLLILSAIVTLYLLVRRLFGVKSATLSLFLMSISPMIIRYSDEARMYALAALITSLATYLLVVAKSKRQWVMYGLLVAAGMLTHYLTLLIWLTHWLWRASNIKSRSWHEFTKKFFSPDWILSYTVAIVAFLPWLPAMINQLTVVQSGFWISAVSVDSFTNFVSNLYLYREHNETVAYFALVLAAAVAGLIWLSIKVWPEIPPDKKLYYKLIVMMSVVPTVLMFVLSLPPLKSTFVERYVLASAFWWMIWLAVTLIYALKISKLKQVAIIVLLSTAACLVAGSIYVYQIGNYNKNNNTVADIRSVVQLVNDNSSFVEPMYTEDVWNFMTIDYYATTQHPAFFKETDDSKITTYDLLRSNTTQKVQSINDLTQYRRVWQLTSSNFSAPSGWKIVRVLQPNDIETTLKAYELEYVGNN